MPSVAAGVPPPPPPPRSLRPEPGRGEAEVGDEIDEPGINGAPAQVEDPRVRRRRHVGADGLDEPVAHHDGAVLDHALRHRLDADVGQRPGAFLGPTG